MAMTDREVIARYRCPNGHLVERRAPPPDEGPPDPDRWGNRRVTLRCPDCRAKGTITFPPHGGVLMPEDWEELDDDAGER